MNTWLRVFLLVLTCAVISGSVPAQKDLARTDPLVGKWKSDEAVVVIKADGTISINDEPYKYKTKGGVITVWNDDGSLLFPYELKGDVMAVDFMGRTIVYKRVKETESATSTQSAGSASAGGEGIIAAFVGKWCYLSSLTGTNSYMSTRCFTLYENGTYEFKAESSSSGSYGSTAGQSYDTGRWTATRNSITAYSRSNGKIVYPIELRNHPKTRDPMIVLDGDAYVTAYRKNPW
jgi:hypothetical protein